jgi:hypothetical protein
VNGWRRMSRRRAGILALLLATLLALTACTGLPTAGPVNPGVVAGAVAPPEFTFTPQKPQDGASPEQIVQGFIDAGSGSDQGWATARLYLAPSFRDRWEPRASVTVDDRSLRRYSSVDDTKVALDVTPVATVDDAGAYGPSTGGQTTLPFTLAKVDKQWRITSAPQGIVLGADQFGSVFRQYSLMYFDPTWTYLVPDVRWFPITSAVTQITQALIDGKPSPWLAGSVYSAFPDSVSLAVPSVPVVNSVAQVAVSGGALSAQQVTLDRMQTQLVASLATAGVSAVAMTYGGSALSAQPVAVASTRVPAQPLVMTAKGFGFLAGGDAVETVGGISDAIRSLGPTAIQLSADELSAAARVASGAVVRVAVRGSNPSAAATVQTLDHRAGLVAPAVDTRGFVWSVPEAQPAALTAFAATGDAVPVASAWADATRIDAMALSRDGTRLAAIVAMGGESVIEVAGIVRAGDGTPQSLGQPMLLAVLPGSGIDITWLDDETLGALSHSADGVVELQQTVGGPSTTTATPDDATTIAGSTGSAVRLRTADGSLYAQRGSNWEQVTGGILVLADAQGLP